MVSSKQMDVGTIPCYEAKRRRRRSESKKGRKGKKRRKRRRYVSSTTRYSGLTKMTRNPFMRFLRHYRQRHNDWTVTKTAVEAARKWCGMTKPQRRKYLEEAEDAGYREVRRRKKKDGSKKRKRRRGGSSGGRRRRKRRIVSATGTAAKQIDCDCAAC